MDYEIVSATFDEIVTDGEDATSCLSRRISTMPRGEIIGFWRSQVAFFARFSGGLECGMEFFAVTI